MGYENLQVRIEGDLGRVTLSRPERFNALSLELLTEAIAALDEVSADPAVKVIIIDCAGRGFSVGHDLNEMIDREREFFDELFTTCTVVMEKIQAIPITRPSRTPIRSAATNSKTCRLARKRFCNT